MHRRIAGIFRDTWYLMLVIVAAGALFWFLLAPLVGVATVVLGAITTAYFGIVRYDDEGHERTDRF